MKTSLKLYLTALIASFLLYLVHVVQTQTQALVSRKQTALLQQVIIKSSLDEVKLSKAPEKIVTLCLVLRILFALWKLEKNIVGMPHKNSTSLSQRPSWKELNIGSMVGQT